MKAELSACFLLVLFCTLVICGGLWKIDVKLLGKVFFFYSIFATENKDRFLHLLTLKNI